MRTLSVMGAFNMRKIFICFAALIGAGAQAAYAQTWAEFKPPGAGFAIEMPGEWTITDKTVSTKAGPTIMHIAAVGLGPRAYMITYNSYPAADIENSSATKILDGARDGEVNGVHGTLRSEQRILVSDYPGREIVVDTTKGYTVVCKIFMLKNELVQAIVVGGSGIETEANTTKYLNSLHVVPDEPAK